VITDKVKESSAVLVLSPSFHLIDALEAEIEALRSYRLRGRFRSRP
jgi:hypothetical protein